MLRDEDIPLEDEKGIERVGFIAWSLEEIKETSLKFGFPVVGGTVKSEYLPRMYSVRSTPLVNLEICSTSKCLSRCHVTGLTSTLENPSIVAISKAKQHPSTYASPFPSAHSHSANPPESNPQSEVLFVFAESTRRLKSCPQCQYASSQDQIIRSMPSKHT